MRNIFWELTDPDDHKVHERVKEIVAESETSSEYYQNMELFAMLLCDPKSYVRSRGFILCCSQAQWDEEDKLNQLLPAMLVQLQDPKPTVVRQCLKYIQEVVKYRPQHNKAIKAALNKIDLSLFAETMRPLIEKDIAEVREMMGGK